MLPASDLKRCQRIAPLVIQRFDLTPRSILNDLGTKSISNLMLPIPKVESPITSRSKPTTRVAREEALERH